MHRRCLRVLASQARGAKKFKFLFIGTHKISFMSAVENPFRTRMENCSKLSNYSSWKITLSSVTKAA